MIAREIQELEGVYSPSTKEKCLFFLPLVPLSLVAFHVLRQAMSWGVEPSDFLVLAGLLLFSAAMAELTLRSVKVDKEKICGRSPIGLYRQKYRLEEISSARLKFTGRGWVVELNFRGRWIVFLANAAFKARIGKCD
jgi:hypothetical protein